MSEKKNVQEKFIYLIPYAHLDTQWRWEYPTTIKKSIKHTLDENFYLFDKYPDYIFNFTGSLRYAMMKEYYPEKYEKAKKYIEQGRWCLSGTCLDETDTLSPSVESMIRNILYGDRWAKKEFGKSSRDYMIPDCFGFPGNMPSVLSHCGIQGFSTQKLTWGSAIGIPFEIGRWIGPDQEGLVCALNPGSYNHKMIPPLHKDKKRIASLYKLGEKNGIWKSFHYYGVGDVGGAPKVSSVRRALQSINLAHEIDPDLVIKHSSSSQFFSEVTEEEKARMDTYTGDLLLINHSAGSLTSATIMKRWNRKNEQHAFIAEAAAVCAFYYAGARYPTEKIESAWYRTIGNQMHDILPGTCTPSAYEYSHNDEVVALKTWQAILEDCAEAIAPFVSGSGEILVFNPLGEARTEVVDVVIPDSIYNEIHAANPIIVDSEGNEYPVQISTEQMSQNSQNSENIKNSEDNKTVISFIPSLKPISWSRFAIHTGSESKLAKPSISIRTPTNEQGGYTLENQNLIVSITREGVLHSIVSKKLNRNILKTPLAYEFQKESPSAYPAWNMDWKDRKNPPYLRIEDGMVSVVEQGPIRCTLKIVKNLNASVFERYVSLSDNSEIVDLTEKIHWREQGCSLKLALNPAMNAPKATFNWETSHKVREVNNEKLFEMPSRNWVDISEKDEGWGISLIEDSKYGYDHPTEDMIRMTMIYTPGVNNAFGYRDQATHDWGEHTIRYGLFVHEGNQKLQTTDFYAKCLNQRARVFYISQDASTEEKSQISMFTIDDNAIGVSAIKKAEEGNAIVLRVYDRVEKAHESQIRFDSEILDVHKINGLEEKLGEVQHTQHTFTLSLKANGLASYLIHLKEKHTTTADSHHFLQQPVEIPYNFELITGNKQGTGLFPSELVPHEIFSGNTKYVLASNSVKNAVLANNQAIAVPDSLHTLYLLAGSQKDCDYIFRWADADGNTIQEEKIHIPSMTGYLGQWDTRLWKFKPLHRIFNLRDYIWLNKCVGVTLGFVKKGRLEFYTTHTHKNGKDQPYQYGYMNTVKLNKPIGATQLLLPSDTHGNHVLYIIAATMTNGKVSIKSVQSLADKYDF